MILQALVRYYDILLQSPDPPVPPYGYSTQGVSFALNISREGEILDIIPLYEMVQRGRREVERPRTMFVPEQFSNRAGTKPHPNFAYDNATFILGISDRDEDQPEYSVQRFEAFRTFHHELLDGVDSPAAKALLAFLDRYDHAALREHPVLAGHLDDLRKRRGNLVFLIQGTYAHEDPAIRRAWEVYKESQLGERMQCLVTGETEPIARLHPKLRNVRGGQPTGVSLVGFNLKAFESYKHEQGQNAPVGERATFAYTTALNYLLSDANPNRPLFLGDTTVVYWAESTSRRAETAFAALLDPTYGQQDEGQAPGQTRADEALRQVAGKIRQARLVNLEAIMAELVSENPRFYVLGLAPNAGRVSVRFFVTDLFQNFVAHIADHYRDLAIEKEFDWQPDLIPIGQIMNETFSKKAREGAPPPLLAGAVFRAILINAPYPAALYYAIINRVRADMDDRDARISKINYVRAAVVKAYLLRTHRHQPQHPYKEVLTMSLNANSTIPAYVLGRLFAVLERAQVEAIGDINASIKDRYFTSACASPATVFPLLLRLSQHHTAKAEYGRYYDRLIQDLLNLLDLEKQPFPRHLTLEEQGLFILGYYHQRAAFYQPKGAVVPEQAFDEVEE